jgi:hypothetical protein
MIVFAEEFDFLPKKWLNTVKCHFLEVPGAMRTSQKPKLPQTRRGRGPSKVKQTEMTKAVKATLAAGLPVRGIDVDPATGKITVMVGEPVEAKRATGNPWDEVLTND